MLRLGVKKINLLLSMFLITAMLFGSVGTAQAVPVGNDTVDFIMYRYDYPTAGESTWYYKVVSGSRPAISHITFELNLTCLQIIDAGTWNGTDLDSLNPGDGNPQIGLDPTTGITGLKFDEGFQEGETRYYYFTVDHNYLVSNMVTVASKGGPDYDTALIQGPSGDCEYYPPNPTPDIDIEKLVNGVDADEEWGPTFVEGETLTFDFIVTNEGNVDLVDVAVTDSIFGNVCTIGSLGAGEIATCSISVPAELGQHVNVAYVTGLFTGTGAVVDDADAAHYTGEPAFVPAPAVDLEKFVNGDDADAAPGVEVIEGDAVAFDFVVTNTGNVPLTSIIVTDDVLGAVCDLGALELAVGASTTCSLSAAAGLGAHVNVGTATGSYASTTVTDSDPGNYTGTPRFIPNPIIDIEKLVNYDDADVAPGVAVTEGDAVEFTFIVTNQGNVALSNVEVNDTVLGFICSVASLNPGETFTCTTVVSAAVGEHANTGTVTGEYNGSTVTDSDDGHYTAAPIFIPNPAIDIEKFVNGQDADALPGVQLTEGDAVGFDFVITNTGNVDLIDLSIVDNVLGPICTLSDLAVGATSTCSIAGLTAERGQHVNVGTVTGSYEGTTVSDSDTGAYSAKAKPAPMPGLKIKKYVNGKDANEAPGLEVPVGSLVTFTYMVQNTGTVTLTNIMVADNILGQICVIPSLAPGQIVTCTATATAVAGQYMNIGKAGAWYGDPKNGGVKVTSTDVAYYFGK